MSDSPTAANAPLAAMPQLSFACSTCHQTKPAAHYGKMRGKRNPECLVCARERWTRNRRARLVTRRCMSCKQEKHFSDFETIIHQGRRRLAMSCRDCTEAAYQRAHPEPVESGAPPEPRRKREPSAPVIDYSQVAQDMAFAGRTYSSLDQSERGMCYALARELTRQFSPLWRASFDDRMSPQERLHQDWARAFLQTATLPECLRELPRRQSIPSRVETPDITPVEHEAPADSGSAAA